MKIGKSYYSIFGCTIKVEILLLDSSIWDENEKVLQVQFHLLKINCYRRKTGTLIG